MSRPRSFVLSGRSAEVLSSVALDLRTAWWPGRRRLAIVAATVTVLTAVLYILLGGAAAHLDLAAIYVLVAMGALFSPAAVTAQVIAGQALAGSLLTSPQGPRPLLLVPVLAGVVATAELLAAVARLDASVERSATEGLGRMGAAAVVGAGVYAAVALVGDLPGPTGLLAVVLASGAFAGAAWLLVRRSH